MFAIVKTGGKQYKVRVGETIDVEKLDVKTGGQVRLDQVLLAVDEGDVQYGRPVISGAAVTARVVRQHKGPKLIVFKYKSKSRYRRRTGHRQNLTQLAIQSIEVPGWETARAGASRAPARASEPAPVEAAAPVTAPSAEPIETATPAVDTREAQAWPAVSAAVAEGSAAPVEDVLTVVNPAAQVEETEALPGEPAIDDIVE